MQGNDSLDKIIRYSRPVKIVTLVLGCAITVSTLVVSNCGATDSVSLQIPAGYQAERSSSRLGYVAIENQVQRFNIDDYTYVADDVDFVLENIKESAEVESLTYDGNRYLVDKKKAVLYSDYELSEELERLKANDVVIVISSDEEIAYVKTSEGERGYMKKSALSDEPSDGTLTPTTSPTPTKATKDAKATAAPTPKNKGNTKPVATATATPTPTATKVAEPTKAGSGNQNGVSEDKCKKTVYTTDAVNLRKGPGTEYDRVRLLSKGEEVKVVAKTSNGWYKTNEGYYLRADLTSEDKPQATPTDKPSDQGNGNSTKVTGGNKSDYSNFADYVKSFIGVKYVFAACAIDKVDCSGLTKYCFGKWYGLDLPHSAHSQSQMGKEISIENIKTADIVCFDYNRDGRIDHVGIYVGGGVVVHASETRGCVRASSLSGMSGIATIRRLV